jgi:flavin-dependent thymidylate synthase
MKVQLLDYTGIGQPDPSDYAAKLLIYTKSTRLPQTEETRAQINEMPPELIQKELDAIVMTVRSSWEFIEYTFLIRGVTRAFTHQLVRTRTASYAQEAQRVADLSNFEAICPATIQTAGLGAVWDDLMEHIRDAYKKFRAAGIAAQDARAVLPTNVTTNIMTKMNLRTLADLVGKRANMRAQDEYQAVVIEMVNTVLGVHPWAFQFFWPTRTTTPELDEILSEQLNGRSPVDVPRVNAALKQVDALKGIWG